MSRPLLNEEGQRQQLRDGHSQVSGDWGLRVRFGSVDRVEAQPDLELVAAGRKGLALANGPVREVQPERELIAVRSGAGARIKSAELAVVEALKLDAGVYYPKVTDGRRYGCKREANFAGARIGGLKEHQRLFLGKSIGLLVGMDDDGALDGLLWLHRYQYPILGSTKAGTTFELTLAPRFDASGWYMASNPLESLG